ncbi:MAG: GFA family protein [Gammaproteobacteria bacterium]|nr:GFA family protein [Gammaproteobacteria bacterium]
MQQYNGSCHCGSVRFSYSGEVITRGLHCNCSLCSRKGAMMSAEMIPEANLTVEADAAILGLYQFGAETAKHYFCRNCGIYTHHETARKAGHYRVNLGCVEGVDGFSLEADLFDGAHLL